MSAFVVAPAEAGRTLAAVLRAHRPLSWAEARRLIERRQVRLAGQVCADPVRRVRPGQRVEVLPPPAKRSPKPVAKRATKRRATTPTPTAPIPLVVYADDDVVVVDKPPGLTTMRHAEEAAEFGSRGRKFLPATLADLLPKLLGDRRPVRAVHRLDRDTSGLVVFARTLEAEAHLGKQFRAHTIGRRYLAVVRGRPPEGRIESWLVRDRGDGRRGSGLPGAGQRAVTHVRVLAELGPGSLVECRLETGRTHQVRIHLGEAGAPLAGERVYDRPVHGAPLPDPSGSPRVALHAARLGLAHPATGAWLEWESPLPADLAAVVERLRGKEP